MDVGAPEMGLAAQILSLWRAPLCFRALARDRGDILSASADAGAQHGWRLDLRAIAAIWRAGCIIRARMLDRIMDAYEQDPALQSLLLSEPFRDAVASAEGAWRKAVSLAVEPASQRPRSRPRSPTATAFDGRTVRRT